MKLLRSGLLASALVCASVSNTAELKFPTSEDLRGIRNACAGGDVQSIDGRVEAALSTWRKLTPGVKVDLTTAKKDLGAVMEKVTASADGNALYANYVSCVRSLTESYLTGINTKPAAAVTKESPVVRPQPAAVATPSQSANDNRGAVIQGNNNSVWMGPPPSDPVAPRAARNFDRLVSIRSTVLTAERKLQSVDSGKVERGDVEERRRLLLILAEVNDTLRTSLDELMPYVDRETELSLRADSDRLGEAEKRMIQLSKPQGGVADRVPGVVSYIERSNAFRANFRRLVEEQIRRND